MARMMSTDDNIITANTHCLSETDSETHDTKAKPKQTKMAAEPKPKTRSKNVETAPVTQNQPETAPDLGEIKRIYAEMVELRTKLDADQAETARLKEEARIACETLEEDAGYVGQHGGGDGTGREAWDYDNDTQEEGNWLYGEDEDSDQEL